jgi:hypothetical protein
MDPYQQTLFSGGRASRDPRLQNALIDTIKDVRQMRGLPGYPPPLPGGVDPVRILVQNNDTAVIPWYGVLSLAGQTPIILPSQNIDQFRQQVTMQGIVPSAAGQPFVIVQEPLVPAADDEGEGECGIAVIAGATWVQVNVNSTGDGFAQTKSGDATQLDSVVTAVANSVPILWKASGTGTQWALVLLAGSGSAAFQDDDSGCGCGGGGSCNVPLGLLDPAYDPSAQVSYDTSVCAISVQPLGVGPDGNGINSNNADSGVSFCVFQDPPNVNYLASIGTASDWLYGNLGLLYAPTYTPEYGYLALDGGFDYCAYGIADPVDGVLVGRTDSSHVGGLFVGSSELGGIG